MVLPTTIVEIIFSLNLIEVGQMSVAGKSIYEPAHYILVLIALSSNVGLGKPEHMGRLAIAFTASIYKV